MKLFEIRTLHNKTQKQVAEDIKVSAKTYNNYENRNTEPDIETLKKLADYFCVSVDYLIGHECKNKLDLTSLTENQQSTIDLIKQLSEDNCKLLNAYANGLLEAQKQQEATIKRLQKFN